MTLRSLFSRAGAIAFLISSIIAQGTRPNVLWITSEDNGPELGAYGDEFASTPHLDALAERGLLYTNAWSNAPVCAPARTAIITGVYPTSTGTQHMRSTARLPAAIRMFPQYLREAGYYCTNRSKEDYNAEKPGRVWDDSSRRAHWRGRGPDQPFFAVMNITATHEGQVRKRPHEAVHDAASVPIPAYHPDHPDVRRDWAQYYDKLSEMDAQVGRILAALDADGLRDSTIVLYFGDHGPGMPRSKRWPYNSGLHVPLIASFPASLRHLAPEGYEPGGRSDRRVGFVDLAPTMLSLAGLTPPPHFQGRAFCGAFEGDAPRYAYGFRDRMDERYDLVRSLRDERYVYIRNYMPHRIYGEHVAYMFQTPTTRAWKTLYDQGALEPPQTFFWEQKPFEELYDLASDPDEVKNLAQSPEHRTVLERMRAAQREFLLATRDLGFLPESELHRRAGDEPPFTLGHDPERYPLERILVAAELASSGADAGTALAAGLADADSAVRYWSATGLLIRGQAAVAVARDALREALVDPVPAVRIVAAEALALYSTADDARQALQLLVADADLRTRELFVALQALGSLDALDERARPVRGDLRALPTAIEGIPGRFASYVPRLLEKILADLAGPYERVYIDRIDGRLRLHVYEPATPAPLGGRPAVVFFHGGGWNSGSPSQFFDQCAHLAARGIVGISAEYRLKNVHGTTPFECVADGRIAMRFVRERAAEFGIDPARIAAGGGSAGGHIAAAIAAVPESGPAALPRTSDRPDALLLFNPVFDNGPEGYGNARLGERWRELSPLHNIHARMPPTLVLLGTEDKLIPVATAEAFARRMRDLDRRCEVELYEGGEHGFFNRRTSEVLYARTLVDMDAFLASLGWLEIEEESER